MKCEHAQSGCFIPSTELCCLVGLLQHACVLTAYLTSAPHKSIMVPVLFAVLCLQPPPKQAAVYVPPSLVPTNVFRTGRTDCATAPNGDETSSNFPDGLKGQSETFAFFKNL